MPRFEDDGADETLRQYLLAVEADFRERYIEGIPEAAEALSIGVNQLSRGETYSFPRYMLPGDHPARLVGGLHDMLVLTEDNQLCQLQFASDEKI